MPGARQVAPMGRACAGAHIEDVAITERVGLRDDLHLAPDLTGFAEQVLRVAGVGGRGEEPVAGAVVSSRCTVAPKERSRSPVPLPQCPQAAACADDRRVFAAALERSAGLRPHRGFRGGPVGHQPATMNRPLGDLGRTQWPAGLLQTHLCRFEETHVTHPPTGGKFVTRARVTLRLCKGPKRRSRHLALATLARRRQVDLAVTQCINSMDQSSLDRMYSSRSSRRGCPQTMR